MTEKRSSSGFKGFNNTQPTHSGGFKHIIHAQNKLQSVNFPDPKPFPVSNMYDKLGISQSAQSNIDRMKDDRFNAFQKQLAKGFQSKFNIDVMKIYDAPGRKQEAVHIPSSLLEPTLQNVEAQLEAHRIALKPLQERYFQMRGLKPPSYVQDVAVPKNIGIQWEAQQLIYKMKNGQIGPKTQKQLQQEQLQRMFQQKKKLDPKLAEYDRKFRQYKLQKQTVQKAKNSKKQSKNIDKQMINLHQQNDEEELELKEIEEKYDINNVLATNNDKFICKFIFKQLDKEKKGVVSKQQLYDFMLGNQLLTSNFKIDLKWFYSDLQMFKSKRKGLLTSDEATKFLVQNKLKHHPELQLIDPTISSKKKSNCLLGSSQLNRLEQLFKSIDQHSDNIVPRQELIAVIYNDEFMIKKLDNEAIRIPHIDKTVTLRQVLDLILREYRSIKDSSKKKAKEFITLKQWLGYFQDVDVGVLDDTSKPTQQSVMYDIQEETMELIHDIFNSIPRVYKNYVVAMDFVEACKRDPQFKLISQDICRIQSVQTKLPAQNLKTLLNRISLQTDQYECWGTIKSFFSRRGRPIGWDKDKLRIKKEKRQKQRKQQFDKMLKTMNIQEKKQYLQSMALGKTVDKDSIKDKIYKQAFNYTLPQPFDITDEKKKPKVHCQGMLDGQKQFDQLKTGIKFIGLNKQILEPKLADMEQKRKRRSEKNRLKSKNKLLSTQDPFSFHQRDLIAKLLKEAAIKEQMIQNQNKQMSIKANQVPNNLKKTYKEIMEQQQRKRDQERKKNQDKKNIQISKSLYPDNPADLKKQKNKKVAEKMKKIIDAQKRKQQQLQKQKQVLNQKNKQKQKKHQQKKKQEEEQQMQRNKITDMNQNMTKKPKINDYKNTGAREQGKKRREQKQKQMIQEMIRQKEEQRKKRLQFKAEQKQKLDIENMDEEDILDKLSQISLSELLQQQEKLIWKKRRDFEKIPFSNKYKMNKDRRKALMMKQRKLMQQQEKARRMEKRTVIQDKIKSKKSQIQKNITNILQKNKDKKLNINGKQFGSKFNFNQSRALRRYYDLMEGKTPASQYDRMSHEGTVVSEADIEKLAELQEQLQDLQNTSS